MLIILLISMIRSFFYHWHLFLGWLLPIISHCLMLSRIILAICLMAVITYSVTAVTSSLARFQWHGPRIVSAYILSMLLSLLSWEAKWTNIISHEIYYFSSYFASIYNQDIEIEHRRNIYYRLISPAGPAPFSRCSSKLNAHPVPRDKYSMFAHQ